jgi:drug/metabolite transporter (DMT)-like permease
MTDHKKAALLAEISLMLAAVFWGANYAATKYAAEFMPPLLVVAFRFTVGGVLVSCLLLTLKPGDRIAPKDLLPVAGLGCLYVAVGQGTFTLGIHLTSAANTGLIFATSPAWGLLLGSMLGLERPTWKGILGVGLSILGVSIVFYEGLSAESAGLSGDLLVLVSAMTFGAYTVFSMPMLRRHSPMAVAAYSLLFGGLVVLLLSVPFLPSLDWAGVGVGAWAAVIFSGVFATAFAFSAWQIGISRIGANRVLVYQYLITLTGVASGIVFFGESLGVQKLVGGAVILIGVYLARRQ